MVLLSVLHNCIALQLYNTMVSVHVTYEYISLPTLSLVPLAAVRKNKNKESLEFTALLCIERPGIDSRVYTRDEELSGIFVIYLASGCH